MMVIVSGHQLVGYGQSLLSPSLSAHHWLHSWSRLTDVIFFYQVEERDRGPGQPGAGMDAGGVPVLTPQVTVLILSPLDRGRGQS